MKFQIVTRKLWLNSLPEPIFQKASLTVVDESECVLKSSDYLKALSLLLSVSDSHHLRHYSLELQLISDHNPEPVTIKQYFFSKKSLDRLDTRLVYKLDMFETA